MVKPSTSSIGDGVLIDRIIKEGSFGLEDLHNLRAVFERNRTYVIDLIGFNNLWEILAKIINYLPQRKKIL